MPRVAKAIPVAIKAPNFREIAINVYSTAPLAQGRWTEEAMEIMKGRQAEGHARKKGTAREPRNFERQYNQSYYQSAEGWYGIPATLFRKAMISACRIVGFKMTLAKLALFIETDGMDSREMIPLVRIEGEPTMRVHAVRNATGVADLRSRAFFDDWKATVRVRFDADMFKPDDVVNLLARAGLQVGVMQGRPDSTNSAGMDWGTFKVEMESGNGNGKHE